MQTPDMQTQKKRGNYNKVFAGFAISGLVFARTVKWSQIGEGEKKHNKQKTWWNTHCYIRQWKIYTPNLELSKCFEASINFFKCSDQIQFDFKSPNVAFAEFIRFF